MCLLGGITVLLLQGDSGGPLITYATESEYYYHVIGVASYNVKCEVGIAPDLYTRVTGEYNNTNV